MRQLLTVLLPLLLPFLAYAVYVKFARERARQAGHDLAAQARRVPWVWILAAGCVLMTATLLLFAQQSGYPPGTELTAPSWLDGEIVPSRPVAGEEPAN